MPGKSHPHNNEIVRRIRDEYALDAASDNLPSPAAAAAPTIFRAARNAAGAVVPAPRRYTDDPTDPPPPAPAVAPEVAAVGRRVVTYGSVLVAGWVVLSVFFVAVAQHKVPLQSIAAAAFLLSTLITAAFASDREKRISRRRAEALLAGLGGR